MALASYSDLVTAVGDWLARTDLNDRIPDFILMGEATLNKVLRDRRMITSASLSISSSGFSVAAPTNMLEPIMIYRSTDPGAVIEQVSVEQLQQLRRHRTKTAAIPKFCAMVGADFQFTPTADASYTFTLQYYQTIPALASNPANWLITYNPDIYLYTTLMHAAPFLRDEERAKVMTSTVVETVRAALGTNAAAMFNTRVPGASLNSPSDIRPRAMTADLAPAA